MCTLRTTSRDWLLKYLHKHNETDEIIALEIFNGHTKCMSKQIEWNNVVDTNTRTLLAFGNKFDEMHSTKSANKSYY